MAVLSCLVLLKSPRTPLAVLTAPVVLLKSGARSKQRCFAAPVVLNNSAASTKSRILLCGIEKERRAPIGGIEAARRFAKKRNTSQLLCSQRSETDSCLPSSVGWVQSATDRRREDG